MRNGVHYIAFWPFFGHCGIQPLQILDFCAHIRKILMKMQKLRTHHFSSVHYIKHYTFLHKHVKIADTTLFLYKNVKTADYTFSYLVSTISKHYTLLYKHVKTADYTFSYLVSTISNTTFFVYKHVKIASIKQNVHYIKHYTLLHFSLQTVHYIK